jgi:hypothetical protein
MGLFKKTSPEELEVREAETELIDLAGSVGQAVGRCAIGEMPGDFLSSIVEAHSERMQESFAVVARSRGQEKTWDQTMKHACRIAATWTHNRVPASRLVDPVADALRASLGTSTMTAATTFSAISPLTRNGSMRRTSLQMR